MSIFSCGSSSITRVTWGHKYLEMEEELGQLLGRKVDVVSWRGIEQSTNPVRRGHILKHARPVFAQG